MQIHELPNHEISLTDKIALSNGSIMYNASIQNLSDLLFETGTFTPQLYDYNTYVRDMPSANYYKLGSLVVAIGHYGDTGVNLSGISTMIQIRNLPMHPFGGVLYIASLSGNGANQTFQYGGPSIAYIRPNLVSSSITNASSPGVVSFTLIGTAI